MSSKLSSTSNGTFHSWPANVSRSWPQRRVRKCTSAPSSGKRRCVVPDLRLVVVGLHQDGDLLALEAHPRRRPCRSRRPRGGGRGVVLIMSAQRSAIITIPAWQLPDGTAGITLASATRRPSIAVDAQLGIDDGELVEAHRHEPAWWWYESALRVTNAFRSSSELPTSWPGQQLLADPVRERLRREELARELHALDEPVAVGLRRRGSSGSRAASRAGRRSRAGRSRARAAARRRAGC